MSLRSTSNAQVKFSLLGRSTIPPRSAECSTTGDERTTRIAAPGPTNGEKQNANGNWTALNVNGTAEAS